MDIKKIRQIVIEDLIDEATKRLLIIDVISEDPEAIVDVLEILNSERKRKKKMISEMNELISKSDVALENPKLNKDTFINKEISEFYKRWDSFVKHLWK